MTLPSDKPLARPNADHGAAAADAHNAPVRVAQVTADAAAQPIGKVETLDGNGTIQHNGVTVAVTKDMPVYQGDLVTAGAHSNIGIVFDDKSVFSINDGGSMTLNDFVYNPSATHSNNMLFDLVKGSAGFITGHVVKTGDMNVGTPVAVIAVRGTTVIVQCPSEVMAHPSCTFQAATGRFDLVVDGKVLTSVALQAVKVQDGHFSFDFAPKTPQELQNYHSIMQTLEHTASSASIELHKEGGVIESHPIHQTFVEIAFNDGTTFTSPLETFASMATIAGASTVGSLPPLTTEAGGEEAAATSTVSAISAASSGTTPLVSPDNPPVITSEPQTGSVTETANVTGDNTVHMQSGTITFTDADTTDTHSASVTAQGSSYLGTFAVNAVSETSGSGSVPWTFSVQDSALDFLKAGEQLVQTYDVQVSDGHGGTANETVTITLTGTNDAPVTAPVTAATDVSTVISGTVADSTTDVDTAASALTYAVIGAAPAGLTFHADGSWSYDPTGQFELAHNQTATVSFDYQANDGMANSNVSTATITVAGPNAAPVLTVADPSGQLTEGDGNALLTTAGTLSVSDADATDTVTVSQSYNHDIALSGGGTLDSTLAAALVAGFDVSQTGWSYATTQNLDFLAAGQTITFSYTLVATDSSGAANDTSAPATVTITIDGTADTVASTVNGTSGDDNLFGTSGNDLILPGDATSANGDTIHASAGNDTVDFTGAVNASYHLDYSSLGVDLTANIGPTGGTIAKAGMGTDSLANFDLINGDNGTHLLAGSGNDTFNVNLSGSEFLTINVGTGADTITNTGSGFLQVDLSSYHGVYADAVEGIATENTGTSSTNVTGTVDAWIGTPFNDTLIGSSGDETFSPGLGNDSIDGGGGFDLVSYDNGGATNVFANFTAAGTATVIDLASDPSILNALAAFGQAFGVDTTTLVDTVNAVPFMDTLTHIEGIVGTSGTDILVGGAGGQYLDGGGGFDGLIGGAGSDTLIGGSGSDFLQDGAGANVFDLGNDTVPDLVQFTTGALKAGDPADLIMNFHSGSDFVDLSQLFTATNATDLTNYARIHNVGGTTELQIASAGDGNYSAVIANFDSALSTGTSVNVLYDQNGTQETQGHLIVS